MILLSDMRWHSIGSWARVVCALAIGCVVLHGTVDTRAQSLPRANAAPDPALGQAVDAVPADTLAFDVVSIRQNKSGGAQQFGPTPNGYRMTNMPLLMPILTAYVPTTGAALFAPGSLSGVPGWAQSDRFDIDARVSQTDLANWQKPDLQTSAASTTTQSVSDRRLTLLFPCKDARNSKCCHRTRQPTHRRRNRCALFIPSATTRSGLSLGKRIVTMFL